MTPPPSPDAGGGDAPTLRGVPQTPSQEGELVGAVQRVSLARSVAEIQDIVRVAARRLIGADGATFVLREHDRCFYADEDAISPLWKGQRLPMRKCISGWVMRHRQPATIPDVFRDPRVPPDLYRPTFVKSVLMVPIRRREPVGAIGNYWAHNRTFSDREVALLQALADTTAVALENVSVLNEREAARLESLQRLALAAEYRDDGTHEHTARVGQTSYRLAQVLGIPDEEASVIGQAAQLHDVGKMAIPDAILLKRSKLDRDEFERIKSHTTAGATILGGSKSNLLRPAEQIALTHHERWDGTGYPHSLSATEIPLSGRIVALADVFDALTHARPYKPAWAVDDTIAEIRGLSGRQFDPTVVQAFSELDPGNLVDLTGEVPSFLDTTLAAAADAIRAAPLVYTGEDGRASPSARSPKPGAMIAPG